MKKAWMAAAVVMLGLCLAGTSVYAERHMKKEKGKMHHSGMMGKGDCQKGMDKKGMKMKFMHKAKWILANGEELELSDDQQTRIEDLMTSTKKSLIKQDADIKTVGVDFWDTLSGHKIDVGAANNLIDKKYDLKRKRAKSLVKAYADLKQILTEDQYEMMKKMK